MKKVSKILTLTDVGKTNSHLSAIRIPSNVVGSKVLPELSKEVLNPKIDLVFYDENGKAWVFPYIFYNDKFHGKPARLSHNEYRLSRVKDYINAYGIQEEDEIWFSIDDNGIRRIGFVRKEVPKEPDDGIIHIRGGWKIYTY
ncbi:MAG: hypothetical protein K6G85_05570 [Eubacterium sp.]|nr:hypothetical protein [Eubacterium sp.]